MESSVIALLLEFITLYAYGGVYGSKTAVMAETPLRLFLLAPRLLLHSSRDVAERAHVLLVGSVESFNSLYQATQKPSPPFQPKTDAQQTQQVPKRVSKFIERATTGYRVSIRAQNTEFNRITISPGIRSTVF